MTSFLPVVFVQGWAGSPEIWAPLARKIRLRFPEHPLYFMPSATLFSSSPAEKASLLPQGPFYGVGHSSGVLWLLLHGGERLRGLVSLGGFTRFGGYHLREYAHTQKMLLHMKGGLNISVSSVVHKFYERGGGGVPFKGDLSFRLETLSDSCEESLLQRGLDFLRAESVPSLGDFSFSVERVHSLDDKIVSPLWMAGFSPENFPAPPHGSRAEQKYHRFHCVEKGGHFLPFTRVNLCLKALSHLLETSV